jgi:hypothetical protein
MPCLTEGLHRCFTLAKPSSVRSRFIKFSYPVIDVNLQFFYNRLDFLPEGDVVELMFHRAMEALVDVVGLRIVGFGF